MIQIVARRHKLKFYTSLALAGFAFLAMGAIALAVFTKDWTSGYIEPKGFIPGLVGVATLFLGCYTVYKYFRNTSIVRIDESTISFNGEHYAFSEIDYVLLTGKRNFPYLLRYRMEAATIGFTNGSSRRIFDDLYENAWEIKLFLHQHIVEKKRFAPEVVKPVENSEQERHSYETYKGNQLTSMRGITLWVLVLIFCVSFTGKTQHSPGGWVFLVLFLVFWFLFHSWLMHYFQVSHKYFVIRNHNRIFRTKAFRLSDIREIVFETQGKMPICLRLITKDFKCRLYPAGTLREKTWLKLKERLEGQNIKVRNECI